ncbi:MAG TPA: GNAT family N-acetyltransferase [Parvularculaceae bacterium]|nr:GNAT family N-acetyltransferase [Parvularculaceae bacterium]
MAQTSPSGSGNEDIRLRETATGGRYSLTTKAGEAELVYHLDDAGRMVITHTYSPPEARGRGVALRLVERVVEDARARKMKIVPQCPYVAKVFERRQEWSALRA